MGIIECTHKVSADMEIRMAILVLALIFHDVATIWPRLSYATRLFQSLYLAIGLMVTQGSGIVAALRRTANMRKLRESSNWPGQPEQSQDSHSMISMNSTAHLRPPLVQPSDVERTDF